MAVKQKRGAPRSADASVDFAWKFCAKIATIHLWSRNDVVAWYGEYAANEKSLWPYSDEPGSPNSLGSLQKAGSQFSAVLSLVDRLVKEADDRDFLVLSSTFLGWLALGGESGAASHAMNTRRYVELLRRTRKGLSLLHDATANAVKASEASGMRGGQIKRNIRLEMLVAHAAAAWYWEQGQWPTVSKSHMGPFSRFVEGIIQEIDSRFRPRYTVQSLPSSIFRILDRMPDSFKIICAGRK